jgi:hypothetical protein
MLQKVRYPAVCICLLVFILSGPVIANRNANLYNNSRAVASLNYYLEKYQQWQLAHAGITAPLFTYAIKGYSYLLEQQKIRKSDIITVIDFSQPSTQKRLFVIDLISGRVLFNTWVAHGRNSGLLHAEKFSNTPSSYQSSLGFYSTDGTYNGKHGYSLHLQGCETGINHLAEERNIVVHGASYVSESFIRQNGYLGRSQGCPALPEAEAAAIIDVIKNGTCIFIYHPQQKYLIQSPCLKG